MMKPANSFSGLRGVLAIGIVAVLAAGPTRVAIADPGPPSRAVVFADLNISEPSGAHALYMRILAAAQVVCSYYPFATDGDKARCVRDAIADAVNRIDQPELSAIYHAKNSTLRPGSLESPSR